MNTYSKEDYKKLCNFFKSGLLFEMHLKTKSSNHTNFDTALIITIQNFQKFFKCVLTPLDIINILESFKEDYEKQIIKNKINKQITRPRISVPFSKLHLELYTKYNQKEAIKHFSSFLNFRFNEQQTLNFAHSIISSINNIKDHQYRLTPDDIIKGLKIYIENCEN